MRLETSKTPPNVFKSHFLAIDSFNPQTFFFGQKSIWKAGFYHYFEAENSTVHDFCCKANSEGLFQSPQGSSMWFIMILSISGEVLEAFRTSPDVIALVKMAP